VQRLDVAAPGIEDACLGPVLGQALHDLGGGDERVVGLERPGAVAGGAVHDQAAPVAALLAHRHLERVTGLGRDRHATALGDDVVALHGVGVMLDEMAGAEEASRLLVGHGQVDQGAARAPAAGGEPPRGHRHRRGEVQHVDGAAAPHDAVDQLGGEGIALPPGRVHGHHVGVAHEQQRGRLGIAALDAGDEAHAAGLGGVALAGEAGAREEVLQRVHAAVFVARGGLAGVDAAVADQRAEQLGGLGLDRAVLWHLDASLTGGW
jgi:hypothetical protein